MPAAVNLPTGNFEQLVESVQVLSELDVGPLYPGHMAPVLSRGTDHIRMALRNLTEFTKEELLLSRLRPLIEQGEDIIELIRSGEVNKMRKKNAKQRTKTFFCLLNFKGRRRRYRNRKYPMSVMRCGEGIL